MSERVETIGNYEAGAGYVGMKRSSKTAPWDGAPRSEKVLGEASERPIGILRAVTCLANAKLEGLREQKEGRKKEEGGKRRKKIWSVMSGRRKEKDASRGGGRK